MISCLASFTIMLLSALAIVFKVAYSNIQRRCNMQGTNSIPVSQMMVTLLGTALSFLFFSAPVLIMSIISFYVISNEKFFNVRMSCYHDIVILYQSDPDTPCHIQHVYMYLEWTNNVTKVSHI